METLITLFWNYWALGAVCATVVCVAYFNSKATRNVANVNGDNNNVTQL